MKNFLLNIFIILFTLSGCKQTNKQIDVPAPAPVIKDSFTSVIRQILEHLDSGHLEIYNFLQALINAKELDTSYALSLDPSPGCSKYEKEITFLQKLIIEESKPELVDTMTKDSLFNVWVPKIASINFSEYDQSLTKKDVEYMLAQKPDPDKLRWNNSRLGFNMANKENWYRISIPLFSRDHKKVVIMIESLCPGLCGNGRTTVYIKEKGKWVGSAAGGVWFY